MSIEDIKIRNASEQKKCHDFLYNIFPCGTDYFKSYFQFFFDIDNNIIERELFAKIIAEKYFVNKEYKIKGIKCYVLKFFMGLLYSLFALSFFENKNEMKLVAFEEWDYDPQNKMNTCYFRFYRHFFTDLKRKGFDGHIVNLRNPKLHQIWKKKNQKNHFSLYSERKIFSQMSNLLRIFKTFHILKLSLFLIFKYITFFVKLDNYQLTFFIHLCCQLASYYNIFGKLAHYNALITANETSYTPIARNIANNLGIALVLIPNGGRINFGEVSYFITCNVFISWSEVYKSFTLGGIVADLYLNAGSLNMIKDNTRHLSNALMPRKFDFLLVEQNVFPDLGFCADHRYHLIMLKHFCRFAREYPQYSYGYLCRHSRKPKSHSDDFNRVISNNDLSLRQSNVEILHRNIPGQSTNAVHSSKVILALDSSIRIEALLCGKLCLSLNYCQANDDIFSFLFKYPMIIMDKDYSTFKNAMLSFFDEQQIRSMRTQISESKICDLLDKHFARKTAEYIADF